MKIGILSRGEEVYSTKRLVEAATERGHEVEIAHPAKCYMNITTDNPSIHYAGEPLDDWDAVIPRIASKLTFYGTSVLRYFEIMGALPVNDSLSILRSRDKLRALQILSKKGVGMPITGIANSPDNVKDLIKMVGGAPLVIKMLEGTQGIGVVLAETQKAAESVIQAFMSNKINILVQEFIKEAGGADIRCFVIEDKVVAAMMRQAPKGEFRSNLHRGGEATMVKLSPKERKTAVFAAQALGLSVCGVDIIRSERGPLVMEVNSSPGLEGIEATTGKNIAGLIIEFIERKMGRAKGKKWTRDKG